MGEIEAASRGRLTADAGQKFNLDFVFQFTYLYFNLQAPFGAILARVGVDGGKLVFFHTASHSG